MNDPKNSIRNDYTEHIKELEAKVLANAPILDTNSEEQDKEHIASDSTSLGEKMGAGMRPMLHELVNKSYPKWTKAIAEFYHRDITLSFGVIQQCPLKQKHRSNDPVGKTLLILDSSFSPPTRAHAELVHMALAKYTDPKVKVSTLDRADFSTEEKYKSALIAKQLGQEKIHGVPDVLLLLALSNMEKAGGGFPTPAQKMIMMYALAYRIRADKRYARASDEHSLLAPQIDLGVTRFGMFMRKHFGIAEYYGNYYDKRIWIMGSDTIFRIFDPSFYARPEDMEEIYSSIMSPQDRVMVVLRSSSKFGSIEEQREKIKEFDPRAIERLDIFESTEVTDNISSTLARESLARGGTEWKKMIDSNVARFAILQGFYAPVVKKGTPNCPKTYLRLGNEVSRKTMVRSWLKEYDISIHDGRFGYERVVNQNTRKSQSDEDSLEEDDEGRQEQRKQARNFYHDEDEDGEEAQVQEAEAQGSMQDLDKDNGVNDEFNGSGKSNEPSQLETSTEESPEMIKRLQEVELKKDEKKVGNNKKKQDKKVDDEFDRSTESSTSELSELEEKEALEESKGDEKLDKVKITKKREKIQREKKKLKG